jgi:hypothetical protein
MDALYQACSGLPLYEKPDELLPFVCEARDAIIHRLVRSSRIRKAWIITTDPRKREEFRRLGARIVVLTATQDECRMRVRGRPAKTQDWNELILLWRERYVPHNEDTIVGEGDRL